MARVLKGAVRGCVGLCREGTLLVWILWSGDGDSDIYGCTIGWCDIFQVQASIQVSVKK